ncbi:MAG: Ig-like domain-containing protein [Clostridia bacterium]
MKSKKILALVVFIAVALMVVQPYTIFQNKVLTFPGTVIVSSASTSGVSISKTAATLKVGLTLQLTATVKPADATDKTVKWTTSNAKVATVTSAGKVTAKGKGSAKITVTTTSGSYKASCTVTVVQPVTSVKLNKATASILKGKTLKLLATVLPTTASNKKVTWKSSSTAIATVNTTGTVTAKKKGIATITVTTVDGKKTAKCKVTVK